MSSSLYFTTGQAAQQLGVSQAQLRAHCASGAIASESTPGGQYRITEGELARLKREGLPPLPRPLPSDGAVPARNGHARRGHPELMAEPSEEVISGAEEVVILENEIKALDLKAQREVKLDFFRERERRSADEEAERQAAEQRRRAEAETERQRQDRDNAWLTYAMNSVPYSARNEVEEEIHAQVRAVLDNARMTEPTAVVQRVVDAAVARVLQPWRRRKQIKEAIEDARDSLPSHMRTYCGEPTVWENQTRQAAAKALEDVRPDASRYEMRTVAREAVKPVIAAFESHKAAQEDAELRQSIIRATRLPAELTEEGKEVAVKAITDAMAQLPPGTPRPKLEQACENALAPFHAAIARLRAEQRAKDEAEARQRQDHASRESVIRFTSWKFPYDLLGQERTKAVEAVRTAIAALSEGTPESTMEEARDRAIQPILDAHARRKRTGPLVEAGLRQILPYVQRLETEWELDKNAQALEANLKPAIRKRLEADLIGDEPADMVAKKVRRLVRQELDIPPA